MPLPQNTRIHLARFLANNRIHTDTRESIRLVNWLTKATEEPQDDIFYNLAVRKMLKLGWTTQEELDAEATKYEDTASP